MNDPIVIAGAGVSGLRAASLLSAEGIPCKVLEARNRIGGRVLSYSASEGAAPERFDLGPTWFWPQYETRMTSLVKELQLTTFSQYTTGALLLERSPDKVPERHSLPPNAEQKSMRIKGGMQSLSEALAATLPQGTVALNTCVTAIRLNEDGTVTVEAVQPGGEITKMQAGAVIMALPPRIASGRIEFSPDLPSQTIHELRNKPAWMAGQAKAVAVYDRPFWREAGLSGMATSWAGPLQEIHDASHESSGGALFGFFSMPAHMRRELGKESVLQLVTEQLERLFGPESLHPQKVLYQDWAEEQETAVEEDLQPLREFPSYGPIQLAGPWSRKIVFAGTEAASGYGGHLEGALRAAEHAVAEVSRAVKKEKAQNDLQW